MADGRSARSTTIELIASALGLEVYIGPARAAAAPQPVVPAEIAQALGLPPDASIADAVGAIDKDKMAARLRAGIGRVQDLVDSAGAAAALIAGRPSDPSPAPRRHADAVVVIPIAPDVRLAAGAGEVVFEESSEVSIAVAVEALASWAHPERLTCVRAVGNSMEPTILDGDLVAVDAGRTDPLEGHLFAVRSDTGLVVKRLRRTGARWLLSSDNPAYAPRPVGEEDRILGEIAWCGPQGRRHGRRRRL